MVRELHHGSNITQRSSKNSAVYVLLMLEVRLQEKRFRLGLPMNPEKLLVES